MITLRTGQAEDALFQAGIASVPERQCETQPLRPVAEARKPILVPAIGAGSRMLIGKISPRIAVGAVVLAHRAPGPFADIRPDDLPIAGDVGRRVGEPCVLRRRRRFLRVHGYDVVGSCQPPGGVTLASISALTPLGPQLPGS